MTLSGSTLLQSDAKPFVKWVGGKRQLLSEIDSRLPSQIDAYFEPFLGGGALFFHLAHKIKEAHLSDMNEDLITAYDAIRLAPDKLIYELSQHKNTQEHFQQIRDVDRHDEYKWEWTPIQKAARFIYLNKTCFNGLYRVNASGHFNVPFGRYDNPKIVDVENIYACNSVLSNPCISISTQSYCDSLKQIQTCVSSGKNVFVYLDPPYIPISVSSSFTSYTKDGFTMNDQLALKQYCDTLTSMGVKWMQSNSAAPVISTMYSGYKIDTVAVQRKVSASSTSRNVVRETIITNYE